jgi:Rps23 Pro-64 3,4-dihydroxylase Tpa1-like proline 4-hydroxylase
MNMTKDHLIKMIAQNLEEHFEQIQHQWNSVHLCQTRYFYLDDVLPQEIAHEIYRAFPPKEKMRFLHSLREKKWTSKNLNDFPKILHDITFAFQDKKILEIIERITKISHQKPDSSLYAGGLSMMGQGHFLNPHIDNSHDHERKLYRTLNLLYYVSPNWQLPYGGNLELWDSQVKNKNEIESRFNRLVVMETNKQSWHSVNKVQIDRIRCCVSNYYFSSFSPGHDDYFHITAFRGRPNEYFKNSLFLLDSGVRTLMRKIFKKGISKNDLYSKPVSLK